MGARRWLGWLVLVGGWSMPGGLAGARGWGAGAGADASRLPSINQNQKTAELCPFTKNRPSPPAYGDLDLVRHK